jgi:gliding motility-associated-like protein
MPVAQFMPDTTHLCERGNVFAIDYQGSISAGSIYKLWSFGDGVSSTTADDTTKSYATFGSYPVRLELVSDFDCRDTIEQTLTVHPQPKAQFTINDSLECFRDHEIVAINKSTLAQGAVQSRTWTTESTDYLNIDTLNQVYSSANDYTIQLTIESDQGCFDSLTKAVTIYPMPVAQFTPDEVCLGKLISFENLSNFEFGTLSSRWSFGDGNTSNEDSPMHQYSSADSFDVTLVVSTEQDCSDTIEYKKIAVVHPVPYAAFDYKKIKSWKKETQYLFSDSSIGADFLRWEIDGFSESNEDDFQFIFQDSGTREVTLIATNEFSCSDTISKTISIFPDLVYYIPNGFTPNGDGLNDVFNVIGLGYADMYNLKLYNRWGELLFESNKISEGWDGRFMSEIAQNGVYIYLVTFRDIGSKKRIFEDGKVTLIR